MHRGNFKLAMAVWCYCNGRMASQLWLAMSLVNMCGPKGMLLQATSHGIGCLQAHISKRILCDVKGSVLVFGSDSKWSPTKHGTGWFYRVQGLGFKSTCLEEGFEKGARLAPRGVRKAQPHVAAAGADERRRQSLRVIGGQEQQPPLLRRHAVDRVQQACKTHREPVFYYFI